MNTSLSSVLCALALALPAQDPVAPPAVNAESGTSEGFGRATNYRTALAEAIEDAVAKVKGVQVARGATLRSRLSIVGKHPEGEKEGWFDGQADREHEWVTQQIAGFVSSYEVLKRERASDSQWEVTVRAQVAVLGDSAVKMQIQLQDDGLRSWQLERFEEGAGSAPFARQSGDYSGPGVGDNLRKSRMVEIVNTVAGPDVRAGSAIAEREKVGHLAVASHRIVVKWQPMLVQSVVEKENKARPTAGPRPEYLTRAEISVSLRVDDVVRGVEVIEESFTVPVEAPASYGVDRLDALVNSLADKAKATVAEKIYFALRPPTVFRKWPGEAASQWLVEVKMSRRVAAGYSTFIVGNDGSLSSPDWQPIAKATLVGGTETSCTFRIDGLDDASRIEADVTEVRPGKQ